jgi:hypothetical protein
VNTRTGVAMKPCVRSQVAESGTFSDGLRCLCNRGDHLKTRQQVGQMVVNYLRKALLESHQEYLFLVEARTIHVKKQGTGFNIREVQNLAEVMP